MFTMWSREETQRFFFSFSQKLKAQFETIEENKLTELKTMVDLGSQFYAQAHMYV